MKGNSPSRPGSAYRINPKRNKPRHIIIKMEKNEHKEKTVKAARGKENQLI